MNVRPKAVNSERKVSQVCQKEFNVPDLCHVINSSTHNIHSVEDMHKKFILNNAGTSISRSCAQAHFE